MDSNLGQYYDMLRKTESATVYINKILPRKEVQRSGLGVVDKKDYKPKDCKSDPNHSIHKFIH